MNDNRLIINVGRQFGSGGKLVALALGRKLGIPVYDQELITKAAEERMAHNCRPFLCGLF